MGCGITFSKNSKKSTKPKISLEKFIRFSSEDPNMVYRKEVKLGQGSFSSVYQGVNRLTNQKVALKFIDKEAISSKMKHKDFKLKEAAILRSLDHPNIIKCFEVYEMQDNFVISEELIVDGTLLDHLKSMTSKMQPFEMALLTYQILSALAYCHERHIVHRDIKLENIFITKDLQVKVADFGCSDFLNQDHTVNGLFGTIIYMAPEIFSGPYNEKVDLWSLGIILYMLVLCHPPFSCKNKEKVIKSLRTIPFLVKNSPEIKAFSPGFDSFILGLLEIDQSKRFSAMQALNHPWLKQFLTTGDEVHSNFSNTLKGIKRKSVIQKTISIYINSFYDSPESFEVFKYFKAIDKDGNGIIDQKELEEELRFSYNNCEAKTFAAEFFKDYDLNQNHFIDYSEFATAIGCTQTVLNDENIEKVFKSVDKNHKGYVTADDLQEFTGVNYCCLLDKLCSSNGNLNQMKLEEFKDLLH